MTKRRRLFESRARHLAAPRPAESFLYAPEAAGAAPLGPSLEGLKRHIAGRHELAFVVSGEALVTTPLGDYPLSPGRLLLIEPGVEHTERPTSPPVPYVMCWLACDSNFALIAHTIYTPPDGLAEGPLVHLSGRTNVQAVLTVAGSELAHRAYGWPRAVRGLMEYLGCVLVRRLRREAGWPVVAPESPTIAPGPRAWDAIQEAVSYCRAHFGEPLRVEDVARAVGYSPGHLSQLFSSCIGQTLMAYVRGIRMQCARDLLQTTDMAVGTIARQVGYSESAHFTRAFISAYGVPPKAYRRQLSDV